MLPYSDPVCPADQAHGTAGGRDVTVEDVERTLRQRYPSVDVDDVLGEDSDYDAGRTLARDYVTRLGLGQPPQVGGKGEGEEALTRALVVGTRGGRTGHTRKAGEGRGHSLTHVAGDIGWARRQSL